METAKKDILNDDEVKTIRLEDMTREELMDCVSQLAEKLYGDADPEDEECGCGCCHGEVEDTDDFVAPVIGFNMDNVIESEFDAEEFKKGIKSMSFVAGQLMALQNAGIKAQSALEYLHATHSQDSDCECAKHVAELQAAVNEKTEKKTLLEQKKNMA